MVKTCYVTGSRGLVASRFLELHRSLCKFITPEVEELDITNKVSLLKYFKNMKIDAIINFAAFTDVSKAEEERGNKSGMCWKINIEGVSNLVDLVAEHNSHYIQISTDMVFPGSKEYPGPYNEDRALDINSNKLTWYGYTKAEGERIVESTLENNYTILRIIYPVRAKYDLKLDYLRKPLKLYDEGKLYPMFTDQQAGITDIDEMSAALKIIVDKELKGIFHASSSDISTPFEIFSYLIEKARGIKGAVSPSLLEDFLKTVDNPVRYPKYGGISVKKSEERLGIKYSTCREIIDRLISQGLGE